MKLTLPLCKGIRKTSLANMIWKSRGVYRDPKLNVPPAIQKLGVEIFDPVEEMKPEPVKWTPPEGDLRFWEKPDITEHPLYNEQPAYCYDYTIRFILKTDQVCMLTKSQKFEGLPENVSRLVDKVEVPNKEKLLQQFIMRAHEWNNTKKLLPKRFDKENLRHKFRREFGIPRAMRMKILLTDLVRLCQSTAAQFPEALKERRLIHTPYKDTQYSYRGDNIIIRGKSPYLLASNKDLQPYADEEAVDKSTQYTMPEIFPVEPTIDFIKEHIYTNVTDSGFKLPYAFSRPHTLFLTNQDYYPEEERQCRALMFCFAYAIVRAREKFGEDVLHLPEPISVQCVNVSDTTLNFTCFQLNTLNFDNNDGIKNFVWFDTGNKLCTKYLPQPWKEEELYKKSRYEDFNPAPFDKMLAMILNGLPLQ